MRLRTQPCARGGAVRADGHEFAMVEVAVAVPAAVEVVVPVLGS